MVFKVGDTVEFNHKKSVEEMIVIHSQSGKPGWVWEMDEEYSELQEAGLLTVCSVGRVAVSGDSIQVYPLNHPEKTSFWYSSSDFRLVPTCTTEIV